MTKKEHIQIHKDLHKNLDKLTADFIYHNPDKLLRDVSILDLIKWSYDQTIEPTEEEKIYY